MKKLKLPKKQIHPTTQYALDITKGKIISNKWVRLACERHLRDLKETKKKGFYFDEDSANHIIAFFPEFLSFYEGDFDDQPFELTPHQKFIVGSIFGWKRISDDFRRFRTAYVEEAKGNGKALSVRTPIPTVDGWSAMSDLRVGDQTFDESGKVCQVIGVTSTMMDRICYKMSFSDGSELIADKDHLWLTNRLWSGAKKGDVIRGVPKKDWVRRPKSGEVGLRTTEQIYHTLGARPSNSAHPQAKWNHRIDNHDPLELPEIELPIQPYTLGAWLGDGDSDAARLTTEDDEIVDGIMKDGYVVGTQRGKKNNKAYRISIGMVRSDRCRRGHEKDPGVKNKK